MICVCVCVRVYVFNEKKYCILEIIGKKILFQATL